jgi:NSS family neurotransmitter:Na+ symporter
MSNNSARTVREELGSRFGFLMVMMGAMIGVGNIWRLPYIAGQNGGGAFLVLMIIFNFLIAIPGLMAETILGKYTGQGLIGTFQSVFDRGPAEGLGLTIVLVIIAIMSYYLPVVGWTIYYMVHSLLFTFSQSGFAAQEFWTAFIGTPILTIGMHTLAIAITGGVLLFGIRDGVERAMKWMVPLLIIALVAVSIAGLTLEGAMKGLAFAFSLEWEAFTRSQTWMAALGQALFSTGLGWGIALTYGSYLSKHDDTPLGGGVFTALGNTSAGLLAIFAVFPAVFAFNLQPTAGTQLTFIVLPKIFSQMPGGPFWAIVFFVGFFFAAISSSIAIVEVAVTAIEEKIRLERTKTVFAVCAVIWLLGLPSAYSGQFLGTMDFMFSHWGLPLTTLIIIGTIGWKIGPERIRVIALNHNSDIHIGRWWNTVVRYAIPVLIGLILVYYVATNIATSMFKTIGGIGLMLVLLVASALIMRMGRGNETDNVTVGMGDD